MFARDRCYRLRCQVMQVIAVGDLFYFIYLFCRWLRLSLAVLRSRVVPLWTYVDAARPILARHCQAVWDTVAGYVLT